ncbi:MAG: extracellular solute-binding protein [Chloroflexi bacterium]|nr:extracellular solute-binding protein [Chloroflexota bacterium]
MMRNVVVPLLLSAVFLAGLSSAGCGQASPVTTPSPAKTTPAAASPAAAGWEGEWATLVAGARKEGELVVMMGPGIPVSYRQQFADEMKAKYGITLNFVVGQGSQLAQKAIQENRAGLNLTDIYISGATTMFVDLKPAGLPQPVEPLLVMPDVKDPKTWFEGKLPFADKDGMVLTFSAYVQSGLSYNAGLISKEELQSYQDLLSPRLKGKIIVSDPTIPGAGNQWVSTIGLRVMGIDWLRQFARQDLTVTRDLQLLVQSLVQGKHWVAIGAGGLLNEAQKAGVQVFEYSPREGGFLTGGWGNLVVFRKPAHPGATRVFLNWLLSKEGQTLFAQSVKQQSARLDVPTDFLNPWEMRQPGVKVFDARSEEFAFDSLKDVDIKKELFGPK